MTRMVWDESGERFYEHGVDRGVLFAKGKPGVPWNGLVSVTRDPSGGEAQSTYLDGVKYENRTLSEEFKLTLSAFTYPDEFSKVVGDEDTESGLLFGQQPREEFGLAYRTMNGNDVDGAFGYKIHMIYNALASPATSSWDSNGGNSNVEPFTWNISTRGVEIPGRKPTSELIIDSRYADPSRLKLLEDVMYGTSTRIPRQASVDEFVRLFDAYPRLEVVKDTGEGLSPLVYKRRKDLKGSHKVGLYSAAEETRLRETNVLGLFRLG